MSTEPDDRLLETALALTDQRAIDWGDLRRELPEDAQAVAGLEALAEIASAHGSDRAPDAEPAASGPPVFGWGRLEARARIGAGAFGEVWSAWDPALQREVALKLRPTPSGASPRRWLEEARRLARVRHSNVVTIHGADEHDGRAGLWMDRLNGRTLEQLLVLVGPCSAREASAIGIDLCAALAAVHAAGLVHGDIKTQNVMREGTPAHPGAAGRIVLMDFGSAHASAAPGSGPPGTPLYSAPEVLRGAKASPRADLYALGVVLYRLVTGCYPVEAKTVEELKQKLDRGDTVPLRVRRPDLPAAFVRVVERALAPDPAQRFADAAEMERALAAGIGVDRAPVRTAASVRRALAVATAALLAVAAVYAGLKAPGWIRSFSAERAERRPLAYRLVQDWVGTTAGGLVGFMVAGIDDWDGDGMADLAVAEPGADQTRGKVRIYRGGSSWSAQPAWTLEGEALDDAFGRALCAPGDLDGDGHPDLAVGAVQNDRGGIDAGCVHIYRGGPGADAKADLVLVGRRPGQNFGSTIAPAGDVNGDGALDLIVGAPFDDQAGKRSGRAYVYFGGKLLDDQPDLELFQGVEAAQYGEGRGIGDFNADGHDDLAVSARNAPAPGPRAGAVFVYFGGEVFDGTPDLVLRGEGDEQLFGALGAGGDVNGDGHPDLLVGAMFADGGEPESGSLYVFFGGPHADAKADLVLRGEKHNDYFGLRSDATTDFDGDGFADLLVSAVGRDAASDSAGAVYFYRGGPGLDEVPEFLLHGRAPRSGFGAAFTTLADTLGDGVPNLAVGSPGDRRAASQGGSAQVFDLACFQVIRPGVRDAWTAGGSGTIEWLGTPRADIALSTDGGRSWHPVRSRVGGGTNNVVSIPVPRADSLRVRIAPADRRIRRGVTEFVVRVRS